MRNSHRMHNRTQRGYTLLELIISTVVMSIIMGAMVATVMIASRSINASPGQALASAGDVVDHVTTDLSLAQSFSEREDNAVTVTVPDRDGDNQAETIRYSWSGQAGDPLMREYNGGAAVAVASNVHSFGLSYLTRTVAPGGGGSGGSGSDDQESENTVQTLIQHDDTSEGDLKDYKVKWNKWPAQYFKPTLPDNATKWKIAQVQFRAKKSGNSNGVVSVQIRTADASMKPTSTVLAETQVNESSWDSSYAWQTVDIGPVTDLDPEKGYCLVIKYVSGSGEVGKIEYEKDGSPMTPNAHWMTTSNSGSSWSNPNDTMDMRFKITGTVTTQGS